MPIYEYRCNQCEREFEKYVQSAQAAVACPGCQSARVTRRLSVVGMRSTGGPAPVPGMSGGGCCGGGGCGCH
jgi:putative FmdB family regulatory protein